MIRREYAKLLQLLGTTSTFFSSPRADLTGSILHKYVFLAGKDPAGHRGLQREACRADQRSYGVRSLPLHLPSLWVITKASDLHASFTT